MKKMMLLAAAAALTLGSAAAIAAPANDQGAAKTQMTLQQSAQGTTFRYEAPQGSGVNWHSPGHWQGYLGDH